MEPPDIVVYNPSETEEPSQQQLDAEDEAYAEEAAKKPVKGKKAKPFISREAEEEPHDPEEKIQSDPEPAAKKPKKYLYVLLLLVLLLLPLAQKR